MTKSLARRILNEAGIFVSSYSDLKKEFNRAHDPLIKNACERLMKAILNRERN